MNFKKLALHSLLISTTIFANSSSENTEGINLGNTVIYSSTGFETTVRDVASNPTIVVSETIEEKHYPSIEDALKDVPAVNVQYQMGMPVIDMRGQGMAKAMTNVQLLVDGIRANASDTSHVGTPVNTVSISQIERIEIIPGGGAVLYGSGTSGGVINVITKKQTGPRATAGYSYGNYRGNTYEVSAGHTIGKLDIDLAYTRNEVNGYRKYNEEDANHFSTKLRYDISDDHSITFRYSKYDSESEIPDSLTKAQVDNDRKQSGKNPGDIDKWDRDKDEFSLEYAGKINDNIELNLIGYFQDTDMHYKMVATASGMNMKAAFDDEKKGATAKLKYKYGNDSNIIFGIEYLDNELHRKQNMYMERMGATIPMTNIDLKATKESISGFVLNTYKYENFEFIQGFRYEKADYDMKRKSFGNKLDLGGNTKDADNFAVELAVNYLYSDTGNVYLKYERGFTSPAPALITNRYSTSHPDPSKAGLYYFNDLDSETYNTFELGFRDTFGISELNGAVFYTLTNDEIRSSGHASNTQHSIENINLDKTERYGFELAAKQDIGKFTFSESYSYVHAKVKKANDNGEKLDGKRIAYVPNHKLSLGVLYSFNERFNIGGDVVYKSATYLTNNNEGGKKNAHAVANIRANFKATESLNLYAGVNNVFDKKYYDYVSYSSSTNEFLYDPAYERNYYVGFKFQF